MTDGLSRTPSDGKSSHGLWPGELKMLIFFSFSICTQNNPWLLKIFVKKPLAIMSENLLKALYLA
jgi:hypothetical protein